jgi:hypothetical protein
MYRTEEEFALNISIRAKRIFRPTCLPESCVFVKLLELSSSFQIFHFVLLLADYILTCEISYFWVVVRDYYTEVR